MTATTTYAAGTILRVRGYQDGRQLPARRAVVVGDVMGRTAVWFYTLGAPKTGVTVQPLYADSAIQETGLTMRDLSPAKLHGWERVLRDSVIHGFGWTVHRTRAELANG